jgi:hypothetical protein
LKNFWPVPKVVTPAPKAALPGSRDSPPQLSKWLVSRSHQAVEFEIQIEDAAGDRAGVLVIIAANVSFRQLRT